MAPTSFFDLVDGGYTATELTRGPWSDTHQHGGPPGALMAREVERLLGAQPEPFRVARFTVEFVRPVPIGFLSVSAQVAKPGRKVQLLTASIACDGKEVCRASALAIRAAPVALPALPAVEPSALPLPAWSEAFTFPFFYTPVGYHTAMELKIARGTWGTGAIAAWMRMRHPLVPGEAPSPLQRVVCAADSGNGVSKLLDERRYSFMNPDLTIYLHRELAGEWVCLDATTTVEPGGIGLAEARLLDEGGPVGRSLQSLLIEEHVR